MDINDVTIICKTHERQAECNRLIASIRRYYPTVRILVADDSQAPADIVGADEVVRLDYDTGLSAGRNRLIERVATPLTLLVDDDCLFYEQTRLEDMIAILDTTSFNVVGGDMGWELMHGCLVEKKQELFIVKGAHRAITAKGHLKLDFCHNFFMARTDVLRQALWPEEIKIFAEHVHWFWVHRELLKVTKCSVAVGHLHNRDGEIGDIRYERMRRRQEYLALSNQMLGIKGRRVVMAQGRALADVRPRSRPPAEPKPRRLLSPDAFSDVFADLKGKRVGYVPNPGNVGDAMIAAATAELFSKFKIQWRPWQEGKDADLDVLAYGGGGSMGGNYYSAFELRQKMLASELPVVILPQSFMGPEEGNYARVFVREQASLAHAPGSVLAPDLALGLAWRNDEPVVMERGLFLRNDLEKLFDDPRSLGDPARMVQTWYDYLRLAGRCGWIITDRLHFAIAGLLCQRRVTLLPNSYHKNRSMYDTWLKDLGCEWADTVPEDAQP